MNNDIYNVLLAVRRAEESAQRGDMYQVALSLHEAAKHYHDAFNELANLKNENALLRKLVDGPKA